MPFTLRDAWTTIVAPEDYDAHMAAIGQAQANALHMQDFLGLIDAPPQARVLIAGAGTGQMFDTIPSSLFGALRPVFTDINPRFLQTLRRRCPSAPCVAGDLEHSPFSGPFFAVAAVLVLEHIDWRRGLETLLRLSPRFLFLVLQRNPPGMASAITPGLAPPGTMRVFTTAHPSLLDPAQIHSVLTSAGYSLSREMPRPVADGKVMLGLMFSANNNQ